MSVQQYTGFQMDTLSTHLLEEPHYNRGKKEEEEENHNEEVEEDEKDGVEEDKEEVKDESATKKQRPGWSPGFYCRSNREVYYYVGQEISINGALDCYAGTVWPAALALCHYLDTHREDLSLVDKAVLEMGAGTGILSVVAALLGASVTATDLPEVLGKLQANVMRNTRGRCRYSPRVAALSWGQDLESTYPASVYRYDYVLAADVVYHHDFLDGLLDTMKHFCQPGTKVIWANKVRFENDRTFTENFKQAFHTRLLVEHGEMKIFMATCKDGEGEGDPGTRDLTSAEEVENEEEGEDVEEESNKELVAEREDNEREEVLVVEPVREDKEEKNKHGSDGEGEIEGITYLKDNDYEDDEETDKEKEITDIKADEQQDVTPAWVPSVNLRIGRDVYHYAGHDILIRESIDSFGAVMWPAALALCSFLDNNRSKVNMQEKEVLELGAGTGLVTIVASLLGASVTATDLPGVLGNLQANVMRNTRGRCRYSPRVAALSWGQDLESTYPASVYRYDYVLAADVVYHHDFLDGLLDTMKHFCQPGTKVIWANKVRFENDRTFTENFKQAFHTRLLVEHGEMKIFMATCKDGEGDLTSEKDEENEGEGKEEESNKPI
ncbi:uncharacterized protein mettl21ca [Spinachia spinachia]